MKILVCGPRTMGFQHQRLVLEKIRELEPTHVLQGGAKGADFMAKLAALTLKVKHEEFRADWDTHGKAAGHIRNQQMLDQGPNVVLAFIPSTGITRGTGDMVRRAQKAGVKTVLVTYDDSTTEN